MQCKGQLIIMENFHQVTDPACGTTTSTVFSRSDLLDQSFEPLEEDAIIVLIIYLYALMSSS